MLEHIAWHWSLLWMKCQTLLNWNSDLFSFCCWPPCCMLHERLVIFKESSSFFSKVINFTLDFLEGKYWLIPLKGLSVLAINYIKIVWFFFAEGLIHKTFSVKPALIMWLFEYFGYLCTSALIPWEWKWRGCFLVCIWSLYHPHTLLN